MSAAVHIRACGPEEIPALLDLWRADKLARKDLVSASDIDWLAGTLEAVYSGRARVAAAEIPASGRPAAIAGFSVISEGRLLLLWVGTGQRGRRVGERLLQQALHEEPGLLVDLNPANADGLAFYRQCGFEPVDDVDEWEHEGTNRLWLRHRDRAVVSGWVHERKQT